MDCPMHDPAATAEDRAHHLDEMFAKLDADKSGSIDRDEFARHHEDMRRKHEADAPANATPEADEHAAHH
jgi:Ca2+-binding EF-hand superfamily protein